MRKYRVELCVHRLHEIEVKAEDSDKAIEKAIEKAKKQLGGKLVRLVYARAFPEFKSGMLYHLITFGQEEASG